MFQYENYIIIDNIQELEKRRTDLYNKESIRTAHGLFHCARKVTYPQCFERITDKYGCDNYYPRDSYIVVQALKERIKTLEKYIEYFTIDNKEEK